MQLSTPALEELKMDLAQAKAEKEETKQKYTAVERTITKSSMTSVKFLHLSALYPILPNVLSSPQKGWIQAKLNAIKGAKNYQYEYKKVGDTDWTVVPSTKASIIITGLESAKEYIARVLPIGAKIDRTNHKPPTNYKP